MQKQTGRNPIRNDFYTLVAEFKSRHPNAMPAAAWRHFTALIDLHPVFVEVDGKRGLCYVPDDERLETRWITKANFQRHWHRLTEKKDMKAHMSPAMRANIADIKMQEV